MMMNTRYAFSLAALSLALVGTEVPASAEQFAVAQPTACLAADSDASLTQLTFERKPMADAAGLTGSATVRVTVDADGHAHDGAIVVSSGSPMLDRLATETAQGLNYRPAIHDCQSTSGTYAVTVVFAN